MIELPLPPSDNRRLVRRNGRDVLSDEARAWKQDARLLLRSRYRGKLLAPTYENQLVLEYQVVLRDKRRDAANCLKMLSDVCKGIIYKDDKWVRWVPLPILVNPKDPRIIVVI